MEDISILKSTDISSHKDHGTKVSWETISKRRKNPDPAIMTLIAQGGTDFVRFLKSLNLSQESDILILPSNNHYYYENKELKSVRILISLRKLNLVKHLDTFLYSLVQNLSQDTNFIGCFSDNYRMNRRGFPFYHPSRLFNRFINLLDSRTDCNLSRDKVSELLGKRGFKTLNMKEMNGVTYFHSKISGDLFN